LGEIELRLTTGITEDGKQTSSSELFDTVVKLIKNSIKLSADELVRLALLTIICIRLTKTDYETLVGLFRPEQQIIFANLAVFGIRYDKTISKSTKAIDPVTLERARAKLATQVMPSERFTCALGSSSFT
jgi:flagellar biosynthesis/type III secretory pathway M-ring protein FliF/YscJ